MASRDSVTVSIAALSERHVEADVAGDPRRDVDGARQHRRMPRHQQHVVERQRRREADGDLVGVEDVGSRFHSSYLQKRPTDVGLIAWRPARRGRIASVHAPWHFLYFFPLPHGHGSLRPTFGSSRLTCLTTSSPPVRAGRGAAPAARPRRRRRRIAPNGDGGGADGGAERDLRRRRGAARPGASARAVSAGVVAVDRREPPQVADDLFLDAILHRLEEREAFLLVLDERIALAVAAQADAFLQVVEAVEVVLPLRVDDLQHDVALDAAQDRRSAISASLLSYFWRTSAQSASVISSGVMPSRSSAVELGRRRSPKISLTACRSASKSRSSGSTVLPA